MGNVYERKGKCLEHFSGNANTVGLTFHASFFAAVQNHKGGNCTSGNLPTAKIAWIHYLAGMSLLCYRNSLASLILP